MNEFKVGDKAIWTFDPGGTYKEKYRKEIHVEIIEVKLKSYVVMFEGTKTKHIQKASKFLRPV